MICPFGIGKRKLKIKRHLLGTMTEEKQHAVCVRNEGYEESLELRKIYEVLDDSEAARDGYFRVVDEDEDYLYPASWFVHIQLPRALQEVMVSLSAQ
jgi:hypothetical protein